jgi:hypothetical protein
MIRVVWPETRTSSTHLDQAGSDRGLLVESVSGSGSGSGSARDINETNQELAWV